MRVRWDRSNVTVGFQMREAHQQNALTKEVLDHILAFVGVLDASGTLIDVNRASLEIAGLQFDEVKGLQFWDCYWWTYDDSVSARVRMACERAAAGETVRFDIDARITGGDLLEIELQLAPLRGSGGEIRYLIPSAVAIGERKRVEESLRSSEQRLKLALLGAKAGVWNLAVESGRTYWSEEFLAVYGYEPDTPRTYDQWITSVHPDDRTRVQREFIMRLSSSESEYQQEFRIVHPALGVRWILDRARIERDDKGRAVRFDGINIDITERKRVEEALRDSEERLRLTTAAGKVGVWDWDIVSNVVQWSGAIYEIHGLEPGSFPGTVEAFEALVFAEDKPQVSAAMERSLKDGEPYEVEFRSVRPDGRVIWIYTHGVVLRGPDGMPLRMLGATVDITERKETELALRESESRYELVMKGAEAGIWDWDVAAKRVAYSPRWKRLRGLSDDEVSDSEEEWFRRIHPDDLDRVMAAVQGHFEGTTPVFAEEYRIQHSDGHWVWILDRGIALRDESGRVVRMAGSATDVTERKLAEEALRARASQQRVVARLGELALNESDLRRLFDEAASSIASTLNVEYCEVLELMPDAESLVLRSRAGWDPVHVGRATVSAGLESQAGYTLRAEGPVVVSDLRTETRFRAGVYLTENGVISGMSCVIRGGGDRAWGVLGTHSTRQVEFSVDDVHFLASVANVLGAAIQRHESNHALRASEERSRDFSMRLRLLLDTTSQLIRSLRTEEVLQKTVELASNVVSADGFAVWRQDSGDSLKIVGSRGLSQAFISSPLRGTGDSFPSNAVVVQPDDLVARTTPHLEDRWRYYEAEGIRSLMVVPLRIHGALTGALAFYCRTPYTFTEIDIELGQTLANTVASALTTSELYESESSLRERAEDAAVRQAFLAEAGVLLARSLDYEQTLVNVARAAVPKFADWSAVDLLDEKGLVQRLAVAHSDPERVKLAWELHRKYPPESFENSGIIRVVRTGEPELVPEVPASLIEESARNEEHLRIIRGLNLSSYICVPLRVSGKVCGTLTFVGDAGRHFNQEDLVVALDIARRAGQAIEHARVYRSLGESEERLRAVIETAVDGIITIDEGGNVESLNPAAVDLFGYGPEEVIGRNVKMLMPEPYQSEHDSYLENFLRTGIKKIIGTGREVTGLRKDGSQFPMELAVSETFLNGRKLFTGIVRDVSARKESEAELKRARDELETRVAERTIELEYRAEQLGRLTSELTLTEQRERERLAQVLHDHLQQLLVGAKLRLGLYSRNLTAERHAEMANVSYLIDEAIAASRSLTIELAPPILREAGLPAGLEWLARWMREKHGLEVTLVIDEDATTEREEVRILLFQSVRELLFNVVKHAGVLEARVELRLRADEQVEIEVVDQGRGFDIGAVMYADRNGDPPFGLFSIRERLSLLGGTLRVESVEGMGSRFVLSAPVHGKSRSNLRVATAPKSPANHQLERRRVECTSRGGRIRVLVVDDHKVMREGLNSLLSHEPEMVVVGEAADGVQAIREALALRPDVILMDFSMPNMDGVEATRWIKSELPQVGIVALSMYEEPDRASAMIRAGASAYHTKSGNSDQLLQTIRRVCTRT